MSIQCSIAKRYVRLVFREEGEFDPLKTQRQFNRAGAASQYSGAAMAVSAFFKLREQNAASPRGMILMSPWMDATLRNPDIRLNEREDPMMSVERFSNSARA